METEQALAKMMSRLRAIIAEAVLTQDTFVEITAIYDNVAYIFLYLESNEVHVKFDWLLPWRDAFFKDPQLDARVLELLLELRCTDSEVEESRRAYVKHLREKTQTVDPTIRQTSEQLESAAKAILNETQNDYVQLLKRLGVNVGRASAAATFYKLVSETESAATRTKLSLAWTRTRDRRLDDLISIVDQMVSTRQIQCQAKGHDSVLAQTLERCRVTEEATAAYLERYLVQALEKHTGLEAEIRAATGVNGNPMDHFGYYIRTLVKEKLVPLFALDECLEYIFFVANKVFGLSLKSVSGDSPHVSTVDVLIGDHECGQINFDLWDSGPKRRSANYTRGIRNRTDWAGLVQYPVAYVSCRFQRGEDGANRITFQNVHSLFHEFGHAVNHLLIRKRTPNQSGLEYLPLERLENLSMWFEKWVYHPQFAASLSLTPEEREGLILCQRIKALEYKRTHVERAITAALDFEVHRRTNSGLKDSFRRMDERFAISRYCSLGDFPVYFTWPMFQANPGANFAYLWGAADSAEKFMPFMQQRIEEISSPAEVRASFSSCFDFDEPSTEPDSQAVFEFYDSLLGLDSGLQEL
jgi:oligopeptidase A